MNLQVFGTTEADRPQATFGPQAASGTDSSSQ